MTFLLLKLACHVRSTLSTNVDLIEDSAQGVPSRYTATPLTDFGRASCHCNVFKKKFFANLYVSTFFQFFCNSSFLQDRKFFSTHFRIFFYGVFLSEF